MVRSIRQLDALRDEWDGLAARFATPLLGHDWFTSCAEAFHRDGDLRVMTVRDRGCLAGIAPLARGSAGGRLELLGASRLYEPSGWLFASPAVAGELAARAVEAGHPMVLSRVPQDSPLHPALASLPAGRAVVVRRPAAPSLGVDTTGAWTAYYDGLSSHIRVNLPRLERKAAKAHGSVQFDEAWPRPAEVAAALETVVEVEGSGWKGRGGSSLGARGDLRDFFERYARRAAGAGQLRVATLRFGSSVAAVELSVEAYGRVWQLKIGYRDGLRTFYPGLLLTARSIRSAFERGLASYEFLGSAAEWQHRWAPVERRYDVTAVYPLSARGAAALCRDAASAAWRSAVGRRAS